MKNLDVYCTVTVLPASRDAAEYEDLAARLLATCGDLFGANRRVQRLVLRVVDAPSKSRWTLSQDESAEPVITVEVKANRGRLKRKVRSKTLFV